MIWNLVATLFAGLGAAGIALILRSLSRKKLPKWLIPVFGGLGMLAYSIYIEYSWFELKKDRLPESAEVISSEQESMIWRPWTFLFPMTTNFVVLDEESLNTATQGDEPVSQFVLYRFHKAHVDQVTHAAYLLNCDSGEMVRLSEERDPDLSSLRQLAPQDPLRQRVCRNQPG